MRIHRLTAIALTAGLLLATAACDDDNGPSNEPATQSESATRDAGYEAIVRNQPAEEATHSPTRDTINAWVRTWGQEPGRLSYVYVQDMTGAWFYYVFEGLPVSYCASIAPPYDLEQWDDDNGVAQSVVPAPAMDAVYYSGQECNTYYGVDAATGGYMEFTVGMGQNFMVYEEPMDHLGMLAEASPAGNTTLDDAAGLDTDEEGGD